MVRRLLGIICVAATAVAFISCSQSAATEEGGKPVVVVEDDSYGKMTVQSEVAETEAEGTAVESVEAEAVKDYAVYPSEENVDSGIAAGEVVIEEDSDIYDSEYMKESPSMIQGTEVPLGDTSYRDNLTDEYLIELADSYFDEGYYVVDADTLAMNGAIFSIDGNRHYFYRGFMAAINSDTQSEIRYYYIMTEEQLFDLINQYQDFTSGYTDNGNVIEFSFRTEGVTLKYYKENMLMEYIMSSEA